MRKRVWQIVPLILAMVMLISGCAVKKEGIDYTKSENWALYGVGEEKSADLFFVCPTVDKGETGNLNMSVDDPKMKQRFIGAINMEKGLYEEILTMYAPYYRQGSFLVYKQPEDEAEACLEIAYEDVRAAFLTYIKQADSNRPFVLAGFSQGSDMVLRLLKEFFSEPAYQERLIAAYCIGWRVTEADIQECPWLKLATGEDDLGSIICFTTEAEGVTDSAIIPAGVKTYAINPLNWKTDSTPADASLNLGACFLDKEGTITSEIPAFTGAYIDENRGALILPELVPSDYSSSLFPEGVYHLYDYEFFYRNLQSNIALRVEKYLSKHS